MNDTETRVMNRITDLGEELMDLTLALASTYSPPGNERAASDVVVRFLDENGFDHQTVAVSEDRPSVVARIPGSERETHTSLAFNSHLDEPFRVHDDHLRLVEPYDPKYTSAWREGDTIVGYGAVNDKGPMACWLIATKALKDCGAELKGDLVLTAVVGEIGQSPVDEYQGVEYEGTGFGTRSVIASGAVADFALVAESTSFTSAWVEAGKANYKITLRAGTSYYTPYIPRPVELSENPNVIVRACNLILALESWAERYQERNTRQYEGGTVVPKVNIGCVRSGVPYNLERTPEVLFLYLDVRMLPGADPLAIRSELVEVMHDQGLSGSVDLFGYNAGAASEEIGLLKDAVDRAHVAEFGTEAQSPVPTTSSMWRDIIPFIRNGIPSLTYGPGVAAGGTLNFAMDREDLVAAARVYARVALDLCNRERGQSA